MKQIAPSGFSRISSLFDSSIYRNEHLGWIDFCNIPSVNGAAWVDPGESGSFLLGIQPAAPTIFWLHTFASTTRPEGYPLTEKLKQILPRGSYSVYTISSNAWYSSLLQASGFRQCDEIIQMEAREVTISYYYTQLSPKPFLPEMAGAILSACEPSFPPLWRISPQEFEIAVKTSNYGKVIQKGRSILGYLLADITDDNCHIQRIAVRSAYQGKGIGSALIRQMVIDAQKMGISNFSLNTNRNNATAIRFYKKINYRTQGDVFPVYHRYIHATGSA